MMIRWIQEFGSMARWKLVACNNDVAYFTMRMPVKPRAQAKVVGFKHYVIQTAVSDWQAQCFVDDEWKDNGLRLHSKRFMMKLSKPTAYFQLEEKKAGELFLDVPMTFKLLMETLHPEPTRGHKETEVVCIQSASLCISDMDVRKPGTLDATVEAIVKNHTD